jgi:hypothetical protein
MMTNNQRVLYANQMQEAINNQAPQFQPQSANALSSSLQMVPARAPSAARFATVPGYGQVPLNNHNVATTAAAATTFGGSAARPSDEEMEDIGAARLYIEQMRSRYGNNF